MEKYIIRRICGSFDWNEIPALLVDNWQWQEPLDIAMQARICCDSSHLHLLLSAQEKNIRAEHTSPLSMVCEDSCMEFFFRPDENDLRYFNFEINPNGAMFIGFGSGRENLVRLMSDLSLFMPQAGLTADGWSARLRIPADFIRIFFPDFELTPGKVLLANCYKCGHKTAVPHYLTWNRVSSPVPSFHRPTDFGRMELE